jgi:hypothetical protein
MSAEGRPGGEQARGGRPLAVSIGLAVRALDGTHLNHLGNRKRMT